MDQEMTNRTPEERDPREIVETFQLPVQEVVETYVQDRPLPGRVRWVTPPPKRRKKTGLWIFLVCAAIVAGLPATAWLWQKSHQPEMPENFYFSYDEESVDQGVHLSVWEPEGNVSLRMAPDHGPELTAQEIYRLVNPAVVTIQVQLDKGSAIGTGVIFTSDGYLLTNYHVVEGSNSCKVILADNMVYAGSYVAGDRDNDLAVLKIDGQDLPAAEIGSSDALIVGDKVYAIGNPLGVELRGTFTDGIVSAISRSVSVDGRTMNLVQTNAALNSGNSGGPLINCYGQVVGINTIKMSSSFSSVEGLGFAIPSASMCDIVNDLLAFGEARREPQIGVSVSQLGDILPDGTVGIEVVSVMEGTAADRAGVQVGDYIVSANGESVKTSQDLLRIRRGLNIGDQLELTIWREDAYLTVVLDLLEIIS